MYWYVHCVPPIVVEFERNNSFFRATDADPKALEVELSSTSRLSGQEWTISRADLCLRLRWTWVPDSEMRSGNISKIILRMRQKLR